MTDPATKAPISVLGAGSWGSALAILLARNGHAVRLWGHNAAHIDALARDRCNSRYLPDARFPAKLEVTASLAEAARHGANFLIAVPSANLRALLRALKPLLTDTAHFAQASKGMEPATGLRLSQLASEELGNAHAWVAVAGPTFAREVALGLPTALTAACTDTDAASRVADWLRNDRVRVYTTTDVVGVETGGAVKNVLAIAAGISDGLGFGANARAALITRGLRELTRLGVRLGGQPDTFMGLSGLGDLVLTCTDDASRNRQVGLAIGRGQSLNQSLDALGQVAEGVGAAAAIMRLARDLRVEMPIVEQVHAVLYEQRAPAEAVQTLLRRGARNE